MFPLLRSLTARYLLQKWDRSLLVALSIALGVATLVSSRLLNQCVDAAALDTTIPVDVADLYVNNGEAGVDWVVADDLRKGGVPGLSRVERFVHTRVALPQLEGRWAALLGRESSAAAGPTSLAKLRVSIELKDPLSLTGRGVLVSRRIYDERRRAGIPDTEPVLIQYTERPVPFALAGVIDVAKDSPLAPFADTMLLTNAQAAAGLMRRPGVGGRDRVSRIDLFLEPGTDLDEALRRAQEVIGQRALVRTPEQNRKSTEEITGGVKLVLNLSSLGAIVVGLFLVYNALAVTVAERRHDIGVFRSLGATRGQIARLFTIEAMLLGALGSLAGIPLGVGLAELAIRLFGQELASAFLNAGESFRPKLSAETAALAVAAGVATALLAALIPALQAAADEPADAVRRAPSGTARGVRWAHRLTCIALVIAGVLTVLWRRHLPSRTGSMVGLTLILTGLFLAMPIFTGLLARLLHPPSRWLFGVEARLAADNLIRSPGRTGVVIGALAAGVALMFQTAGVGKSSQVPITGWLEQVIRADAYVFRGNLVSANSSMTPMDPATRDDLRAIPGVERVAGLKFLHAEYGGTVIMMLAMDARDYHAGVRARLPGGLRGLDALERLPDGNYTLVSDNFAAKWNVKVGDTIRVRGPRGDVPLEVVGIGRDYTWSMGTLFIDRSKYVELFGEDVVDQYQLFFEPGADFDATFEAVRRHTEQRALLVQDRESVHLYLGGLLDRIFLIAYLQQIIIAVVATLGVVMALLISVLQRRRELGLLRAVGATQPQVLKSVLAEGALMGLLGTALGLLMGLPMEWYLLRLVLEEETGFVFDLLLPWREAIGIGLIAVLASTLAGLIPALHAARLRIPDAIAYE
jgi:putative ABC transport system permease protein